MKQNIRYLLFPAGLSLLLSFLSSCSQVNQNPPDYVKSLVAYKEGSDGLMIYFILADASGAMTAADGNVGLKISEICHNPFNYTDEFENPVYATSFRIEKRMFVKTKVGQGAFAHDALICPLGRIVYSSFQSKPTQTMGKVRIAFETTGNYGDRGNATTFKPGRLLEGEETISF